MERWRKLKNFKLVKKFFKLFFDVSSERHQKDYKKDEETVVTEEVETKTTESFTDVSFDDI